MAREKLMHCGITWLRPSISTQVQQERCPCLSPHAVARALAGSDAGACSASASVNQFRVGLHVGEWGSTSKPSWAHSCYPSSRCFSTTLGKMDFAGLQKAKAAFEPPVDLGTKVPPSDALRFMKECMVAAGVEETKAAQHAEVLLAADLKGHFSHGLNRLEMYVNDVQTHICNGNADPVIEKETVSTALVDGKNGLGTVVGNFCMDLAISKAKQTGIGWVCARGSNHYGIAGWYSTRASDQGLIGMSFTNTSPLVAPTRAKAPALGTNPLSVSAPAAPDDPFVLDMATCTVALGKLEVSRRKEEKIPEGWAQDKEGHVTTDPNKGIAGALMPLGGHENNSGYKGYGLAFMVEIFCGILSGGHYGPNVRRWMDTTREADLGQCFVTIDPSCFAPGFTDRMADLMNFCRGMESVEKDRSVLVAGDPERSHQAKVKTEGVISYHTNQITDSWRLAKVLQVTPLAGV
ncbi:Malate/L-lactate dehydrogenase-like [Trinorchestia longiramus]|nr:Malate/L-lactate dehydrogenase-like [Trinorchestia longiramus]